MDRDISLSLSVNVVMWSAYSFTTAVSVLRYTTRIKKHGHLLWDDWIHVAALAQCLVAVILSSVAIWFPVQYAYVEDTESFERFTWQLTAAQECLYWTTIFTSKAVFFALYKSLFGVSRKFMIYWWIAVAITIAAFCVAFMSSFFTCGTSPGDFRFEACDETLPNWVMERVAIMSIVTNGVTDVLLMVLPLGMLLKMHTRKSRKLKILPVFLLAIVTIIVDTIGWAYNAWPDSHVIASQFTSFLLLGMEPPIAVIISALPAVLFLAKKKPSDTESDVAAVQKPVKARASPESSTMNDSFSHDIVRGWSYSDQGQPTLREEFETSDDRITQVTEVTRK